MRAMRVMLAGAAILLVCLVAGARAFEFSDDFEGYAVGTNPAEVYDFVGYSAWNPPGPFPPTDLYKVGVIGENKVLQFHRAGPSPHFPFVLKAYGRVFDEIQKAGVSFLHTQASMGWSVLDVDWVSDTQYYRVFLDWQNKIQVFDGAGNLLGSAPLWTNKHILSVSHRVEVCRCCDNLTVAVIRLDTMQRKYLDVVAPSLGGRVRFGFDEDCGTGVYLNADDFYVKGEVDEDEPVDPWVRGEARFLLMNSPPLEGYRYVGRVRDKIWVGKKPGFLWLDCYVKE